MATSLECGLEELEADVDLEAKGKDADDTIYGKSVSKDFTSGLVVTVTYIIHTTRSAAHKDGDYHRAIHVYIFAKSTQQLLLHKRPDCKDSWPGLWDISSAGHVSVGDTSLITARYETLSITKVAGNNPGYALAGLRGPLQSSNTPQVSAWVDQHLFAGVGALHYPSPITGFSSSVGGLSGYQLPARIQGGDEEHGLFISILHNTLF